MKWRRDPAFAIPSRYIVASGNGAVIYDSTLLAVGSNGTSDSPSVSTDTNAATRFQYAIPQDNSTIPYHQLYCSGFFDIESKDATRYPRDTFTLGVLVLKDPGFSSPPTQATMVSYRNKGLQVYRSTRTASSTSSGAALTTSVNGPYWYQFEPNTKYWVMAVVLAQSSATNWHLIENYEAYGSSTGVASGRGVSLWSARTPQAPVISSPQDGSLYSGGAAVPLTYAHVHPDEISASANDEQKNSFRDVAGIQVQYSPLPTPSNPNPTWRNLEWANTNGVLNDQPGFFFDGQNNTPQNTSDPNATHGMRGLWLTGSGSIQVGSIVAGRGYLAPGDWRIRVRTFSYGHPTSTVAKAEGNLTYSAATGFGPLGKFKWDSLYKQTKSQNPQAWATNFTPDTYPSTNTSPWSEPVTIGILVQVPPPIALSPINATAVVEKKAVTFSWQYRNTANPPYAQKSYTIQMRVSGNTAWTSVATVTSALSSYVLAADNSVFPLSVNTSYEWRVQTTDTTNTASQYSTPAQFWVVPAPESGPQRDGGPATLEGATIGIGRHRAFIYRRGGKVRIGELTGIVHVDWERLRDEISTAQVRVRDWDVDGGNLLSMLQCWAYELVIYRDNGFSNDRVWEGPITLLQYEAEEVTINARDVMVYPYRRIVKQKMNDNVNGDSVVNRAVRVLQNTMAPDDPNVLAYLTPVIRADDARQYRSLPAYSKTAYEEVDDMASNAGLDYTCAGRRIILWSTKHRIGTLPEFTDRDLGSTPIVSEYGMSMANVYAVSDGNGIFGYATRLDPFGKDSTYGLVEVLSSTWSSDAPEDSGTYTQAGIETMQKSFADSAERSISDRYPPPVVVRVPDNTTLNPATVISIQQLIPGVVIPLRSTGTLRTVVATQKLDSLKVTEEGGAEIVTITLSPFNRDDAVAVEGDSA